MSRKRIRYSNKIAQFICDKVAEGNTVAEVCDRLHKGEVPASNTIYKWKRQKPEFAEMLEEARNDYMWRKHEELEYLSRAPLDELFPNIQDKREQMEARRSRMDALKFALGKLAPVLSKDFDKKSKLEVEHKGEGVGQVQIISYALPKEDDDKVIKDEEVINRPTKH